MNLPVLRSDTENVIEFNAGYNQTFTMTTSKEYQLDLWQAPVGTLQNHNIEV